MAIKSEDYVILHRGETISLADLIEKIKEMSIAVDILETSMDFAEIDISTLFREKKNDDSL